MLLTALAGCGGSTPPPSPAWVDPKNANIDIDPAIGNSLVVAEVRTGYAQGDLLKVDVELAAHGFADATFEYKFEWFDEQMMPVETPATAWTTFPIGAEATASVVAVAPNPRCKKFGLKIQRSIRG